MRSKLSDEQVIEALLTSKTIKEAAGKLSISYAAVGARVRRMVESGDIIRTDDGFKRGTGITIEKKPTDEKASSGKPVNPVKSFRHQPNAGTELGINGDKPSVVNIDASVANEGRRFLKDPKALDRIDTLMALRKDDDSREIQNLFRELSLKIFEASLK